MSLDRRQSTQNPFPIRPRLCSHLGGGNLGTSASSEGTPLRACGLKSVEELLEPPQAARPVGSELSFSVVAAQLLLLLPPRKPAEEPGGRAVPAPALPPRCRWSRILGLKHIHLSDSIV